MNIGTKYEYLWQDPVEYPTPTNLCAKDYIDKMLTWVENLLNDEKIFPTLVEQSFPDDFITVVGNIFRRLFRAYGHIYSKYILLLSFYILLFFLLFYYFSHYNYFADENLSSYYNTCFKRFILFSREFNLIPARELEPLSVYIYIYII